MSIADVDTPRLRALMREFERLLAEPGLRAATDANGLPAHVNAGELIESAWGNAVVNTVPRVVSVTLEAGNLTSMRQIGVVTFPATAPARTWAVTWSWQLTGHVQNGTFSPRWRNLSGEDLSIWGAHVYAANWPTTSAFTFTVPQPAGSGGMQVTAWAEATGAGANTNLAGNATAIGLATG